MKFFNTAGPVNESDHYCLPPLQRFDLNNILSLFGQKKYFVLHAPRQTGKTSCLLSLMDYLNKEGKYQCLYFNVEVGQSAREDVNRGITAILDEMSTSSRIFLRDTFLKDHWRKVLEQSGEDGALKAILTLWAESSPRPLVLLIDEIDALVGDTLIAVLRQLRAGYTQRPDFFPQSVILCGVRDVRDYRIHSARDRDIITGGSAFNIKAESLRIGDFDLEDVTSLFKQHTDLTGQVFTNEAIALVWELTEGQPWIVNALGNEVCSRMKEGRNHNRPITVEMIKQAKENIIQRRDTHIDQLVDKLHEERVRRVIEPLLSGWEQPERIPTDDIYYVHDLGLIKIKGQIRIANRIYQEVIPRELTYSTQLTISHQTEWYIRSEDSCLDMNKLLSAFQQFFREHSEHWVERFDYKEAGQQLLLQAFLQRIVNSGGRVEREYGLGRMRTDLLVIWPVKAQDSRLKPVKNRHLSEEVQRVQKIVIELKVLYKTLKHTETRGLKQTASYMDKCGAKEGHLVIFDRTADKPWDEKLFRKEEVFHEKSITIWGM